MNLQKVCDSVESHTFHYALVARGSGTMPALVHPQRGVLLAEDAIPDAPTTIAGILQAGRQEEWVAAAASILESVWRPADQVTFLNPLRGATKMLGIGLNYIDHAQDLDAAVPTEPVSFPKWPHTLLDPGLPIPLPPDSHRVTAEGELALVIGRFCHHVEPEDALDHVLGFVAILDQTAEDILQRNPRFLTRSKNYQGFLAASPEIVATKKVLEAGDIEDIRVSTFVNDVPGASNTGRAMTFGVRDVISLQSQFMPLLPGDVILTGTPGASVIRTGDTVSAEVSSVGTLSHPVAHAIGREG